MNVSWLKRILYLVAAVSAPGQTSPPKYGYAVVSIHPGDAAARNSGFMPGPQGGLRTVNTSLTKLITFAYNVPEYRILDAPGWARSESFDVTYTPEKPEPSPRPSVEDAASMQTTMDRHRQRMQAVLRDRFGLKLREETRELPLFALTAAKGGSKLNRPKEGGNGPSLMMNNKKGELTAVGANMRMLADVLSNILKRPVVDESGAEGSFDFTLTWRPESFIGSPDGPLLGEPPSAEVDGASIFTAVTEQLGLRLESRKGPVTVYIVEKAERPSEN